MRKKKVEYVCKIVSSHYARNAEEAVRDFLKTLDKYRGREIPIEVKRWDGEEEQTIHAATSL